MQREVEIFDACLVLHADHTMNASTFAARVCAATLSDMHSAIVAAIGTLKGPLHGGANEQVMRTLESIDAERRGPGRARQARRGREDHGLRAPGLQDRGPAGDPPAQDVAGTRRGLRRRHVLSDVQGDGGGRLREKGLYPNVDFYAATVYHYLGIPTDLFTPVFSVSRMSGWTAHVIEQHADNRLIRPDSEYIGERDQKWKPIDER